MKNKLLILGLSAVLSAFIASSSAHAAAFTNGGFESGPAGSFTFTTLNSGDTSMAGWTVTQGSIDYINTYWQNSEGTHSVDMSGISLGQISQTFDTIAGKQYKVTFDTAGNTDYGPIVKGLNVSAGNNSQDYTFDITGHNRSSMGWVSNEFRFIANAGSTTLKFTSLPSNYPPYYGAALDNVNVTPVPEPSSLLLGLMSVGGIFGFRRRK